MDKPSESVQAAVDEIMQVLKKHDVEIVPDISFPIYRILPDEVRLAMSIIKKHGMKISYAIEAKKK